MKAHGVLGAAEGQKDVKPFTPIPAVPRQISSVWNMNKFRVSANEGDRGPSWLEVYRKDR